MVGYTEMLKVVENNHTTCEKKKKKKVTFKINDKIWYRKGAYNFMPGPQKRWETTTTIL